MNCDVWNWKRIHYVTALIFASTIILIFSSNASAFEYQREAMETFAALLKIPVEAPSVDVTVQSRTEEEGLIIEDIRWPSWKGEQPIAFVIRPAQAKEPLPAIVCLHGTGGSREAMCTREFGRGTWTRYGYSESHQRLKGWARELARRGYLVLAMTQRGLDCRTPNTNDQAKDLLARGKTLMGAIVYEIRQAVTHLCERPDTDPNRIGMTGMSFGGITTFYTWLVDERIGAAAPLCGGVGSVDVFLKIGARGYHGFYWWIPDMLTKGDQGDFAAAMAPRPLMLWAPLEDIGMPKEGVDRFLDVVRPAYESAGRPDALVIHRNPGEHSFSMEAFEAMVDFFDDQFRVSR